MTYNHFVVERPIKSKKADTGFIVATLLLLSIGLITLYFTTSYSGPRVADIVEKEKNVEVGENVETSKKVEKKETFFGGQIKVLAISGIICVIAAFINLDRIRKLVPAFVIIVLLLNLIVHIPNVGITRNGGTRWINLFFFDFQPSELAKIAIVFFLANLLDKKKELINNAKKTIIPALIILFTYVIVVVAQRDFATSMLILAIGLVMLFVANVSLKWYIGFFLFSIPVALLFIFLEEYRVNRLIAFLNPEYDILGMNFQVNASKNAIANGGFWGQGMCIGLEKIKFIPEIQADYIFAGWVEAMGYIGVLCYFALLGFFSYKAFKIAIKCEDFYKSLLAFGCITIILIQSLMNCGVVCGFFPATGITLPFFSH